MATRHLLSLARRSQRRSSPVLFQALRSASTSPAIATPSASLPAPSPPPPTAMVYDRLAEEVKSKLKQIENPNQRFLQYGSPHPVLVDHTKILSAPETRVTTLPNGLRVATESNLASRSATVGVWIDAGSRFETDETNGTAHFLEHMIFKGTEKRTARTLEEEIENMGGHLNAYTSREQTTYYAKVMDKDVPRALDILADILQNSKFDDDRITRERDVILREMQEVEQQTEEVIFDHLHATAFQYTPLGRTILGPAQNIKTINKTHIQNYISTHYTAPRMVIAASGAVKHEDIVELVKKLFTKLSDDPTTASQLVAKEPAIFTGSEVRIIDDDVPLAQFAVAFNGASWTDPDSIALMVMQSMLGSWNKNSGGGKHMGSELAQRVAQRVGSLYSSKAVLSLDSKEISDLSTQKQSPAVSSKRVGFLHSPKAILPLDTKEISDLHTQKQSPAVSSQRVGSVNSPKAVLPLDSKEIYGVSTQKQSPSASSKRVGSLNSPRVVLPLDKKEISRSPTQKKSPAIGKHPKTNRKPFSKSFVVPSVVPRDSPEKGSVNAKMGSVTTTRANSGLPLKVALTQGPSNSKLDVGNLSLAVESGTLNKIRSDLNSAVPNFHSRLVSEDEAIDFCEDKPSNITSVAEKFETILSPRTPTNQENCDESLCCSKGTSSVKYVNGVAVVLGRTRSLVERFERRERSTDDEDHTTSTSPCMMSETDNTSTMLEAQPQISGREPASEDDKLTEDLMQNHDVFLSTLKSRLTKLQVVRHFWERNDIKGAISAMRKLPDHSVQADVVSAFMEKMEIVTLDLFSCLLPLLIGLLDSQTERHTNVSLEMLLKLVAVFGPVVRSTISAPPVVGVDLQAEHRLECCNQCFIQLQKIQKILPALVRRGGLLARSAQELNFVLQS